MLSSHSPLCTMSYKYSPFSALRHMNIIESELVTQPVNIYTILSFIIAYHKKSKHMPILPLQKLIMTHDTFLSCILILCHLLSSPQHHFQPLFLQVLCFPSIPCHSYYLYSNGFSHQLAPILKTPILITIMYKFIAELCLIVGNTAFQTCNNLFTGALCDDPFLLQVWH